MMTLKIALLQIAPCGSLEGNLNKGMEYCRRAKEAAQTLAQVKRAMRINYFEDGALIQSQVEKYR